MTDEDRIARAKRAAFGDKADLATAVVEGSGISETVRVSLDLRADPELLDRLPLPWTENRDLIVKQFQKSFESSFKCPGRDRDQCCRAEPGEPCSPTWRPHEDAEWYAQKINMYLSQVNRRIWEEGPLVSALAADEAFELGCLFTEARDKFLWGDHAEAGKGSSDGGKKGVKRRLEGFIHRESDQATATAVDALLARGMRKKAAYHEVARRQHQRPDTVRKRYERFKRPEKS
jgi:hypothetical protein